MNWLVDPLQFDFFERALVVGILLGVTCGALGCFVVLRGMAFIGDALAHAVLPGVVIAFLLGVNFVIGALVAGILTALLITAITRTDQVHEDTAIGIVFTTLFALGVVLISRERGYFRDLTHFLFGNILGVGTEDVWIALVVLLLVLGALALWFRDFTLLSFDPIHAQAIGLQVNYLHLGLMLLLALTIVAGIQAVGVVLIASLLITPAATARLLTDRLRVMMLLASTLGAAAVIIGLYLSYYVSLASGGAVVLTSTLFFFLALLFAPKRGVVARRRSTMQPVVTPKIISSDSEG